MDTLHKGDDDDDDDDNNNNNNGCSASHKLLVPQHMRILRSLAGDKLKDLIHSSVTIKSVVSSSNYRTLNAIKNMDG
jgi:hypothetical protein